MVASCQSPAMASMETLEAPRAVDIRNILLATDFDPITESALHYSLAIARRYNARIYLVHVVRPDMFGDNRTSMDDAWREAQRHMTDLLIDGHLQGVAHQVMVEQGDVWTVLEHKIANLGIDLLVIGTHGRSRIGKLLLGSVAEEIFRQATCPVLMVGPNAPGPTGKGMQKILFCTGFSAHSLRAGGYALSFAQRQDAELVVLHVVTNVPPSPEERDKVREQAMSRLCRLVPASAGLNRSPQCLVEFGPAAERILAVAAEQQPGVIVMGVRQPVGFARRLKWATAYAVVSEAACPVLTVRSPDTAEAR
jgi:nucleotide-binding universal stress UspA family protein